MGDGRANDFDALLCPTRLFELTDRVGNASVCSGQNLLGIVFMPAIGSFSV
jgi:hypothetical protein